MSYVRSIYLHKDKSIFKVDVLPVDRFAESLGLPGTPKIKFLSKAAVKQRKNASRAVEDTQPEDEDELPIDSSDEDEEGDDETAASSEDEDEIKITPTEPEKPAKVSLYAYTHTFWEVYSSIQLG